MLDRTGNPQIIALRSALRSDFISDFISDLGSAFISDLRKSFNKKVRLFLLPLLMFFNLTNHNAKAAESLKNKAPLKTKILVAFDFNGPMSSVVKELFIGMNLKLNEAKDFPKNFDLVKLDIGDDVKTQAERVTSAIKAENPDFIIGGMTSNQALILGEIAEQSKIPLITPYATSVKVTENKKYVFRICFDDAFQSAKLAKFAYTDRKFKKGIILFNIGQAYSRGVKEIFEEEFKKFSGTTVLSIGLHSEKDINDSVIEEINKSEAEFILIPSYQIESAALIAKLNSKLKKRVTFLGTDSWASGRFFDHIVRTQGTHFKGFFVQHWSEKNKSRENIKFLQEIKHTNIAQEDSEHGTSNITPYAVGYDTMGILLEVFKKSKNKMKDFTSIFRNLQYEGAMGSFVYQNTQTPKKHLFIYSIDENSDKFFKEFE